MSSKALGIKARMGPHYLYGALLMPGECGQTWN